MEIEPPRSAEPPPPYELAEEDESKIIKFGEMQFEVNKLESAKARIDSLMEARKGYYQSEDFRSAGNRNTYSLGVQIPSQEFYPFIQALENGIGKLKVKDIHAQDVTGEFIDLNLRLQNNMAYLSQYQEILKKAKTIKDVLEVQEKIRLIQEEIESKEGRLKYITESVKYSSLHIEISEYISPQSSANPNFGRRLVNAFGSGFEGFLDFIVALISLWPLFLVVGGLIVGFKFVRRRTKWFKKETKEDT